MRLLTRILVASVLGFVPAIANAAVVSFVVDAKTHSSNTMNGLSTGIIFDAGDSFSVSADDDDTWFLGGGTTVHSNADGLVDYPLYPQDNLTALYGTLVGRVGEGGFFAIGTEFEGHAANAGELTFYNWDSGNAENTDSITATVTYFPSGGTAATSPVPLPASGLALAAALIGLGLMRGRFS